MREEVREGREKRKKRERRGTKKEREGDKGNERKRETERAKVQKTTDARTRNCIGKSFKKSSKNWSGRVLGDPNFIEKAVREATGAPKGPPSKKRFPEIGS